MLKLVGSTLLLCGSTFLGFVAAHRLSDRVKTIEQMIVAVQVMRRELAFSLTSIPNLLALLEEQACGPLKAFFHRCRSAVGNLEHTSMKELWHRSLQETELPAGQEERDIFARLGEVLGRYDSEGQEEFLLYAAEELEVLGVTAGGFLVVLLF